MGKILSVLILASVIFGGVFVPTSTEIRLPIVIDDDSGWTAENGVRGGSGTANDPYRIEGWTIAAGDGPSIFIRNTTAHARISGNLLALSYPATGRTHGAGIWLQDASNVSITGNTIHSNNQGVYVDGGRQIEITGNFMTSVSPHSPIVHRIGIRVTDSTVVEVKGNLLQNLDAGIVLARAANFDISKNQIRNTTFGGALSVLESRDGIVGSNYVEECMIGIRVEDSSNSTVTMNLIKGCNTAIMFFGVGGKRNTISENFLQSSSQHGLFVMGCEECVVEQNEIDRAEIGAWIGPGYIFQHNVLRNNRIGIDYNGPQSGEARNNTLLDNGVHLRAESRHLDARYNWYGSPLGPSPDKVQGNVTYVPWLTEPPEHVP